MNQALERTMVIDGLGERMVGVLHEAAPSDPAKPGVLVIVGGPQYRVGSHRQFVLMARTLAAAGYPVLRFDYRGMGDSEGDVRPFDRVDDDIAAAINAWKNAQQDLPGVVLWGLCDGASAAMIYGAKDERVIGVVAVNPWVRTEETEAQSYVRHYYGARLLQRSFWEKLLTFRVDLLSSLIDFFRKARTSIKTASRAGPGAGGGFLDRMRGGLDEFRGPCLVILSEKDLTADQFRALTAEDAGWREIMNRRRVTTCLIEAADHTFSTAAALRNSTDALFAWLDTVSFAARKIDAARKRRDPS